MRKTEIEKTDILRAAAQVIELYGTDGLNARSVARQLGVSTQPVYSRFKSMEGLVQAMREEGARLYRCKIDEFLRDKDHNGYQAYGMGFVRFAREEKGFFRILYLVPTQGGGYFRVQDPYFNEIVEEIQRSYGMEREIAERFHTEMAIFSFGLASLVNSGNLDLSEDEISLRLKRQFYAQYALYYPEQAAHMRSFANQAEEQLCKMQSKSNT